ncbi:MAG TPA: YncE family protein [Vicinamibacterales bacterium]|nr:YncE family protein [Vicinamibacterales bacterium]
MRKLLSVVVCVLAVGAVQAADIYHLMKEIPIGGEGGWDYLIVDTASHRLYTSHATKIVVADTDTGKVVGEIPDLPGVHGIALAPDLGRGFTSNGRANSSTIVDLKTLKPLGTVATGANPDSIRYSPSRKEVWAFNHTGKSVTVFEAQTGKVLATIDVGGLLEEAVEDAAAKRMYVNVEDKGAIGVLDTEKLTLVATWPIAGCEGPTALAFDQTHHLLLSACDGKMAVVDTTSGKTVASFPIAGDVDGNGFDAATGYAFASSRTGVLTIAHQDARNTFTVVQTLTTQPSGRTMWLDPMTHNVYVPVASTTAGPNGRAQITPNTMKIMVFGLIAPAKPK